MKPFDTPRHKQPFTGMADVTGLGRPVDLRLPSNRLAVVGTAIAAITVTVRDLLESGVVDLMAVFSTAAAVFLGWAIGRELDPDHPKSAALAMPVVLGFGLLTGVEAAPAALALLAIRVIVGSVGRPLKPVDYAVLIGLSGFAGTRPALWAPATLIVLALLMARPADFRIASLGAATAAVVGALASNPTVALNGTSPALIVVAFAVLSGLAALPSSLITSFTDSGHEIISTNRVALARVATGGTIAVSALLAPDPVPTVAPLLAALVSVAIFDVFEDAAPASDPRRPLGARMDGSPQRS